MVFCAAYFNMEQQTLIRYAGAFLVDFILSIWWIVTGIPDLSRVRILFSKLIEVN